MGTPQARCREMHQSGRISIIELGGPALGRHEAGLIDRREGPSRSPFAAIEMNHWGVVRKISGALDRQECG